MRYVVLACMPMTDDTYTLPKRYEATPSEKVALNLRVPTDLRRDLKLTAVRQGQTMQGYITQVLIEALESQAF